MPREEGRRGICPMLADGDGTFLSKRSFIFREMGCELVKGSERKEEKITENDDD
jgi:hypothetical protein